jgi:hypothetical protein
LVSLGAVIRQIPLYYGRHREPRSGVAIQNRQLDCFVGFASSQ